MDPPLVDCLASAEREYNQRLEVIAVEKASHASMFLIVLPN
jgi:hypothetical protein